jgi:hypothetical protein
VEAISYALIIEASVIASEAWGDGQSNLFKAHKRAEIFARARCSEDEIQNALTTCAALPGNENLLLHHVMCFLPAEIEIHADTRLVRVHKGRFFNRVCNAKKGWREDRAVASRGRVAVRVEDSCGVQRRARGLIEVGTGQPNGPTRI